MKNISTEIYYFSGTGNSFAVARDIAGKIKGKLTSISSIINKEEIRPEAEMIGIVFPDYHSGIPNIIRRFILKLSGISDKYIFAVCTYGGNPGISVEYACSLIKGRGGKLSAGFSVKMPYNYIIPAFSLSKFAFDIALKETSDEEKSEMFSIWRKKLEIIHDYITSGKEGLFETGSELILHLVDASGLRDSLGKGMWLKMAGIKKNIKMTFLESIQLMDSGFSADEKCNACGVCSRICPVNNVMMKDGKPSWQHQCEQCFACLQWCLLEAIQFGCNTVGYKRYHHPEVKLSDMM
jgi:ferredoxin